MKENSTIAAIATALSPAGISIIRISGPEALAVADRVYRSKNGKKKLSSVPSHTIHYGFICDDGQMIDEVMVSVMRAPHSFTAEDTVEINCHGGILITRRVLDCVLAHGAAPAQPGEFTKRAFLNGRMDLSQAEAVMDLISAKNRFAMDASMEQLTGTTGEKVKNLRSRLLDEIAFIEAALDDPEHISLDGYTDSLSGHVREIRREIEKMAATFDNGKILAEGIKTVIVGKPNVGKSSLLNVLAGRQRAIVTDVAGTTRDILEEQIMLGPISLILTDTAGIRDTADSVEKIGVEKAREAAEKADLLIYVADSSGELDDDDFRIIELLKGRKSIILLNKSDLPAKTTEDDLRETLREAGIGAKILSVSAVQEEGLEQFAQEIRRMFEQGLVAGNDQVIITNARQKACLQDALRSLKLVEESICSGMPEDMLTIDLMDAYSSLGSIIGEEVEEDLVNRIFEKFCMGK